MLNLFFKLLADTPLGNASDLGLPNVQATKSTLQSILGTVFFVIGALSVVMIIFGGIRYITSAGNPDNVSKAKNTIIYAIVGLLVALAGYAIVTFIIGRF